MNEEAFVGRCQTLKWILVILKGLVTAVTFDFKAVHKSGRRGRGY